MKRYKKIGFIKIEDIWFDEERYQKAKGKIISLHTNAKLEKSIYDFRLTAQTFLLDISQPEEIIFAGFEYKSCRYPINKARRDGVRIWKAESNEEKEQYLKYQNIFCSGKEIPTVSAEELEELEIYCAESSEQEFLGGCAFIISADRETVRYKYGATAHKLNANEAILWEAICDYHKRDFKIFDFGGCIPTDDKDSYYYRHYHFKKKFGGKLSDSYTYFKIKGFFRIFYYLFIVFVKLFFHGDVNGFTVWLNKKGLLQ